MKEEKKVIHSEKGDKMEKNELYTKLYTLSTKNETFLCGLHIKRKERAFCEEIIKLSIFRKKGQILLTFSM